MNIKIALIVILNLICNAYVKADDTRDTFEEIYQNGVWGKNELGEGTSGGGSTLETAKPYLDFVNDFIEKNNIQSVLEIGCGDGVLIKYLKLPQNVSYTGYDVVESILEKNKVLFPDYSFENKNIETEDFPCFDLILCKDVFIHLPNKKIISMIKKIKSHCKWAIISHDCPRENIKFVKDIKMGDYREVDLNQKPFNFKLVKAYSYMNRSTLKQIFLYTKK
jgi:2-polyprenyl-3-methyl-5-hydroxy-6-metoxy-1,4-benzoquinol methylase